MYFLETGHGWLLLKSQSFLLSLFSREQLVWQLISCHGLNCVSQSIFVINRFPFEEPNFLLTPFIIAENWLGIDFESKLTRTKKRLWLTKSNKIVFSPVFFIWNFFSLIQSLLLSHWWLCQLIKNVGPLWGYLHLIPRSNIFPLTDSHLITRTEPELLA